MRFKLQPRGALTRQMNSDDQTIRREARKQYAIWELLKLGIEINSGSMEANIMHFDVGGKLFQFHPIHGQWFVVNNSHISGTGLGSLQTCILHIKEKGGLSMPEAPTAEWCDRLGFHVDKLDNGYYISMWGPDGDSKTYRETEAEVNEFVATKVAANIIALTTKPTN